jgi:hypothetical protein
MSINTAILKGQYPLRNNYSGNNNNIPRQANEGQNSTNEKLKSPSSILKEKSEIKNILLDVNRQELKNQVPIPVCALE